MLRVIKRIVGIAILVLAAAILLGWIGPAHAADDPLRNMVLPGMGAGRFFIGMPLDQAVRMLGSPEMGKDGDYCRDAWGVPGSDGIARPSGRWPGSERRNPASA